MAIRGVPGEGEGGQDRRMGHGSVLVLLVVG